MSEATTKVPYRIKAHHLEVCNCTHGCGCQFAGFPSSKDGSCQAMFGFEVIDGHYGDVDLTGCRLVVAAKWPKAIHEGGGHCALFIDESCSPEQIEGLAMIYSGQAGGMPWEAIAGTLDSVEGPILKPIEVTIDGANSSFRIPGVLEVNMEPFISPVTGEEQDVHIVYPKGGFVWNDGSVCTTETMRIDHGDMKYEHPGQFATHTIAEWTNQ